MLPLDQQTPRRLQGFLRNVTSAVTPKGTFKTATVVGSPGARMGERMVMGQEDAASRAEEIKFRAEELKFRSRRPCGKPPRIISNASGPAAPAAAAARKLTVEEARRKAEEALPLLLAQHARHARQGVNWVAIQ